MRVLLDENISPRLAAHLFGHDVSHVLQLGWSGRRNGELLRSLSEKGFEVLVTADQNMRYQQNLAGALHVTVVLDLHPGRREQQLACCPQILVALETAEPGDILVIAGPHDSRHSP